MRVKIIHFAIDRKSKREKGLRIEHSDNESSRVEAANLADRNVFFHLSFHIL